ncbi:MAG TPA: hypothetical protein VFE25_13065 [Opitutaceae bacterium]|nr:hypothetical protein [Opitutaceae bacterium]
MAESLQGRVSSGARENPAYWTDQWGEIDPHVEPTAFYREDDGRIVVDDHQVVHDLSGGILADVHVGHRFSVANGLIQGMEVALLPA